MAHRENGPIMIRVVQIGAGYWGPNILRNVMSLKESVEMVAVADPDRNRLESVGRQYHDIELSSSSDELIAREDIDAVLIVTPAATHFELASRAISAGKHVFVEKPLTTTISEAEALTELAEKSGVILMVGHVFEYNAAVRKVEDLIESGELGEVYYIHGQRLNLGRVRQDVDVLWNLAPHDFSIVNRWMKDDPVLVQAQGLYRLQEGIADAVFVHLEYKDGRVCHLQLSWLDPLKVRRMTVIGSRKMAIYDDTSPDAKVQIHDKGIDRQNLDTALSEFSTFGEFQLVQRAGDLQIPKLEFQEPLRVEMEEFVSSVREGRKPLTDGYNGIRVVKCLEAASRSLKLGEPVGLG